MIPNLIIDSNNIQSTLKGKIPDDLYEYVKKNTSFSFVVPVCSKQCHNYVQNRINYDKKKTGSKKTDTNDE